MATAQKMNYILGTVERLDELCLVCWFSGIVMVRTWMLTDTGVTTRAPQKYCARCRKKELDG